MIMVVVITSRGPDIILYICFDKDNGQYGDSVDTVLVKCVFFYLWMGNVGMVLFCGDIVMVQRFGILS